MNSPVQTEELPVLEKRRYGTDSSEAEQRAIRGRVSLHAEDVVIYREPPVVTSYTLDLFWERIRELTAGMNPYYLVGDLTGTGFPDAEIRAHLSKLYSTIHPAHVAIFTGKNFMLNVAAKFVLGNALGDISHSVHKTSDQALAALETARRC